MTRIQLTDVRKSFKLSHTQSLKTAMMWWKAKRIEEFEVLKGVNLTVNSGECVAIVGGNGAGKSTLLSLISRIYQPSSGSIEVNGKLAPLLELGAGFHPDLTGLDNILFNGVILGLTRKQVSERIDQIVEFSELQAHIDAPVRTYSSGMQARLGFSIAAHVDADILIVDEVLAVGDYKFEQKCFGFIEEYRANGGTILFVSHQIDAIKRVADRCIWLHQGKFVHEGSPDEIIPRYLSGQP
jgi:lipopolysaccharide transport system ATP-binding protein